MENEFPKSTFQLMSSYTDPKLMGVLSVYTQLHIEIINTFKSVHLTDMMHCIFTIQINKLTHVIVSRLSFTCERNKWEELLSDKTRKYNLCQLAQLYILNIFSNLNDEENVITFRYNIGISDTFISFIIWNFIRLTLWHN